MKGTNQMQSLGLALLLIAALFSLAVASFTETGQAPDVAGAVEVVAASGVGDDHLATEVPIGRATDIATDAAGVVYFVDATRSRVRRIDSEGVITTVFNGGDREVPSSPRALAIDRQTGALYVADDRAHRVWVVRGSTVEPFAGTGAYGFTGDGGPATEAEIRLPADLAIGPDGSLYIADLANHRIRAVASDGIIRTVAGALSPDMNFKEAQADGGLFQPELLAVAPDGLLYVVDRQRRRLQRITTDGQVEEISADATTVSALDVSDGGALLIASAGQVSELRSGELVPFSETPGRPVSTLIWYGADEWLGYDWRAHTIVRTRRDGTYTVLAGNGSAGRFGDGGQADGASFSCHDVSVDAAGQIRFSDPFNGRIAIIRTDGRIETLRDALSMPLGIAADEGGGLYVAERNAHRIIRLREDGTASTIAGTGTEGFAGDGGSAVEALLNAPSDVAVKQNGEILISDAQNRRIRLVDLAGGITTKATLSARPESIAVRADGAVMVSSLASNDIVEIPPSPASLEIEISSTGLGDSNNVGATAVIVGRDDLVFFARSSHLIGAGEAGKVPLPIGRASVTGMTLDPAGNLLMCDADRSRILRVQAAALRDASVLALAK